MEFEFGLPSSVASLLFSTTLFEEFDPKFGCKIGVTRNEFEELFAFEEKAAEAADSATESDVTGFPDIVSEEFVFSLSGNRDLPPKM